MNTVTIKQVMQPDPGKKMGKVIVEHNGQDIRLVAWPDKLSGLTPGMIIDLAWEQESFQGKDGRTVTTNKLTNVGKATGQSRSFEIHTKSDAKAREMFVMGVVGRAMGSGKFSEADIFKLTANARSSWETIMEAEDVNVAAKAKPERVDPELDDQIPF